MSLTRPAYEVTIENLDTGWSATVAAGEAPDPDDGVWLSDGARLTWRFVDVPPCQLEPETATFSIIAKDIVNLPSFKQGDRVSIDFDRPTVGDPIPYMHFDGRITDRDLVTSAATDRVQLNLTAVDPTAEIAAFKVDIEAGSGNASQMFFLHAVWLTGYFRARTFVATPDVWTYVPFYVYDADWSLGDEIAEMLAAGLDDAKGFPVQRYVEDTLFSPWSWFPNIEENFGGLTSPWKFYLNQWQPLLSAPLPALFVYTWSPTDADQVSTQPNPVTPDPDGSVILLDAAHLADQPSWTTDQDSTPNRVSVVGRGAVDPFPEKAGYADELTAQARFGVISKSPITAAVQGKTEATAFAQRYLKQYAPNAADAWQLESADILTHTMDDATLDDLAPLFWTVREPTPGLMGRRVVLHNVDPAVDPTDGYAVFHLAGATFSCRGGRLTITPELVPAPMSSQIGYTAGPTYDAFGASAFGAAKYHDQGGSTDYVDASLTYDKAKFTSL